MTQPAIFLRVGDTLTPLIQTAYATEDLMQQALRDYPDLIARAATTGESGRLLLVRREMPVRGPSGSSGLSLDHLFVDESGIPVLVEVKRAGNKESRREVVAQMLDYAANGSVEWTADDLRAAAEETALSGTAAQFAGASDGDPSEVAYPDSAALLRDRLGIDDDPDEFWQTVVGNLRQGRMRLIFLADHIRPELIRIIEFLNAQMPNTDVLGIELPQYTGPGSETVYVPHIRGRTSAAVAAKANASSTRNKWTEETLLAAAEKARTPDEVAFIRRLIEHVPLRGGHIYWGEGGAPGLTGWYPVAGQDTPMWTAYVGPGRLQFLLSDFERRHPGDPTEQFAQAVSHIRPAANEVARVRANGWRGRPAISLQDAAAHSEQVFAALDETIGVPPALA
jgi:hypothetical protein